MRGLSINPGWAASIFRTSSRWCWWRRCAPQHSALATHSSSEQSRPTQIQCPFHIMWILKIQELGWLVCREIVHTLLRKNTSVRVSDSVRVRSPPILHHVSSYIGWVSADAAATIPLGGVQQPGGQPNCIKEDAAQSRAWNEPSRSLKLYRQGKGPYWGLLLRLLPLSHLRHW